MVKCLKFKVQRLLCALVLFALTSYSQDSVEYKKFFYPSENIASEGFLVNRKPDKYWKNYYENGVISSEGNRKNFLLDSTWFFYDKTGKLITVINYKEGLKEGWKLSYKDSVLVLKEFFSGDVKEEFTYSFFDDGKLKSQMHYVEGQLSGKSYEYSALQDSLIVLIKEYKGGILKREQVINRSDSKGKQGLWMTFYPDKSIKTEEIYFNGKLNGYVKQYSEEGKLLLVEQYENERLISSSKDLMKTTIKEKNIEKPFNTVEEVKVELKQQGEIINGIKVGKWKYFYEDGTLNQEGEYNKKGQQIGEWKWYYDSGKILREENYINGLRDGLFIEYSDSGKIVTKGMYAEGLKQGEWIYEIGDYKEIGAYIDDMKIGVWKHYYTPYNKVIYQGEFKEDLPIGKHKIFYNSGVLKEEGNYAGGLKNGDWIYYLETTEREKVITFRNGEEWKVNRQLLIEEKR